MGFAICNYELRITNYELKEGCTCLPAQGPAFEQSEGLAQIKSLSSFFEFTFLFLRNKLALLEYMLTDFFFFNRGPNIRR